VNSESEILLTISGFPTMEFQPLVHTYFVLGWKDYSHFSVHVANDTELVKEVKIKEITASVVGENEGNCTVYVVEGPGKLGKLGATLMPGVTVFLF
jgi:hypothetical protein